MRSPVFSQYINSLCFGLLRRILEINNYFNSISVAPNDVSVPKEKGFKAARVEKLGKEVSKKTKLVMDKTSKKLVKVKPQNNKPVAVGSPKKGDKAKGKKTKSDGSPAKGKKPKEKKSHITGDDEATKEARALDRAEKKLKFKKQIEKKMAKKAAKLAEKKPNAPGTPKTESSEVNKINKQKDKKKAKKAKKAENALTESQVILIKHFDNKYILINYYIFRLRLWWRNLLVRRKRRRSPRRKLLSKVLKKLLL